MKKTTLTAITMFMILAMTGCGNDHNNPPLTIITQILTDSVYDGDILLTSPTTSTITQGMSPTVQSVFSGKDPNAPPNEYRAFLDFPLTGPNGVPGNAVIVSATLDIVINSVSLQSPDDTIPIRIDLVSFQPPILIASDFDPGIQPALATTTIAPPISLMDVNHHVFVDVTSLMVVAQNFGLPDFQVRILENPGAISPGLIEINDTTGAFRVFLAPLLQVEYF